MRSGGGNCTDKWRDISDKLCEVSYLIGELIYVQWLKTVAQRVNTGDSTSRTAGGDVSLTGGGDLRPLVCDTMTDILLNFSVKGTHRTGGCRGPSSKLHDHDTGATKLLLGLVPVIKLI